MPNALIKTLADKRQNIWNDAKAITDKAAGENRELTVDEQARFDQASADMDGLMARITQIQDVEKANADAEEFLARQLGDTGRGGAPERDLAAEFRAMATVPGAPSVEVRAPSPAQLRALSSGTASAGGATIPTDFYRTLQTHLRSMSGVLEAGPTVFNTAGGNPIEIPKTLTHGAAAKYAEAAQMAGTDPTFGKVTLSSYKFAEVIYIPRELLEDTGVDLTGYIAQVAGENVGLALAPKLVTGAGSGSSEPSGVVTGATSGKTGAAAKGGAFTYEDLIDLYHSVIAPYRRQPSCGWLMRDTTLAEVRKLKDGAGQYIFAAGTAGEPDRILSKPVHPDENVAAIAAGAKSVLFGDFSRYWVRYVGGTRFERSDDFKFDTDVVSFKAVVRADGVLVDQTGAVKFFTGGAAA